LQISALKALKITAFRQQFSIIQFTFSTLLFSRGEKLNSYAICNAYAAVKCDSLQISALKAVKITAFRQQFSIIQFTFSTLLFSRGEKLNNYVQRCP
jgi:hypothetical protein